MILKTDRTHCETFSCVRQLTPLVVLALSRGHYIRYADDTVLISTSPRELQKMLNELEKIGEQYGMSINVNKTECLVVTKLETVQRLALFLKGNSIKQTEHF